MKLEADVSALLAAQHLREVVEPDRLADMKDLVRHGEYGIAVENLCENLYDATQPLEGSWVTALEEIVERLGLDEHYRGIVRGLRRSK